MANTNPRSADASIAGYLYQFDKSILEVLGAPDDASVVLEGYEDVDLRNPGSVIAIQCKYHEAGTFSLKKIRDPLLAMIESFADGHKWQYRLYGHYGQQADDIPERLGLADLEVALTKKGKEGTVRYHEKFSEQDLEAFLNNFAIIVGPSRTKQRETVLTELRNALGGSDADAGDLHYPNAISMVLDAAAKPDEAARTVQRATFVEALNKRKALFTRWHQEFLGTAKYLKSIEKRINSLDLVKSTFKRAAIIGSEELASSSSTTRPVDLIKQIAGVRFGIGRLPKARPWTVIVEADDKGLAEIKADLVRDGVVFEDGFEGLVFSPDIFDRPVLINTGSEHKKISAVSYDLRLVGLSTLETHAESLAAPDVLLSFREEPLELAWDGQAPRELIVADCDLDQIAELFGRLA